MIRYQVALASPSGGKTKARELQARNDDDARRAFAEFQRQPKASLVPPGWSYWLERVEIIETAQAETIVSYLRARGPRTTREIATEFGWPMDYARHRLRALATQSQVSMSPGKGPSPAVWRA